MYSLENSISTFKLHGLQTISKIGVYKGELEAALDELTKNAVLGKCVWESRIQETKRRQPIA